MNNNPLVSVIIPTYNRKDFVAKAIESVLSQTYKNLEIIVIDDCSVDGTDAIALAGERNHRLQAFLDVGRKRLPQTVGHAGVDQIEPRIGPDHGFGHNSSVGPGGAGIGFIVVEDVVALEDRALDRGVERIGYAVVENGDGDHGEGSFATIRRGAF